MWKNKVNDFCFNLVRIIGIIFVGYIFLQGLFTICMIQRVEEKVYYMKNNIWTQLIGILLFVGIALSAEKPRIKNIVNRYGRTIINVMFVFVIIFWGVWIMSTRFWFIGDSEKVYQQAGLFNVGDYSGWMPGGYAYMWGYLNGLILYVSVLLKFFSRDTSFIVFYFVNLIFYIILIISMRSILKSLGNSGGHVMQNIMLMLYFPYAFLITLIFGDLMGFALGCAAIAFLLKYFDSRKIIHITASCLLLILAVIFKQIELILFVAMLILLIYDCIIGFKPDSKNNNAYGKKLIIAMVYAVVALIGFGIPDYIIESASGLDLSGGNSKWANLAMGLQECDKAPGWYNCYEEEVFAANNYDGEATAIEAKAAFFDRINYFIDNPGYAWEFMNKKLASEWNNPTFEGFHIQNWRGSLIELSPVIRSTIYDGGKINILLIFVLDIAQSIALFGVLMYLIGCNDKDIRKLLFLILFIGCFIFFAFWEAKCRYTIPFYFGLIPYAWPGYKFLTGEILSIKETKSIKRSGRCCVAGGILAVLIIIIALFNNSFISNCFKLNGDTQDYYDYIHQYNHNFEWLRF